MNIQEILTDWEGGLTYCQIKAKHQVTAPEVFAITLYGKGMTVDEIEGRLVNLKPGMKSAQIIAVMRPNV